MSEAVRGNGITFRGLFDKAALAAMTLIALNASSKLSELAKSVADLNVNVAVLIAKMTTQENRTTSLESRMSAMEVGSAYRAPARGR